MTFWVWTLCVAGYTATVSAEDIVGYRFRSMPEPQKIVVSESSFSARSRIDCARVCRKYRHCLSFSFDTVARICFIHPETTGASSSSQATPPGKNRIFEMSPSLPLECPESDLLTIHNAEFLTRRSLTSLHADVSCHEDFTLGDGVDGSDGINQRQVTLTCSEAVAQWVPVTSSVQCKRSTWRAPMSFPSFSLPRTLSANWSMCLEGWTTRKGTFNVGVYKQLVPQNMSPFRLQFIFRRSTLCFMSKPTAAGDWTPCEAYPMPPLVARSVFRIRLNAVDVNNMAVYVDDSLIGVHTTALALSEGVAGFVQNVSVVTWQLVDVWC